VYRKRNPPAPEETKEKPFFSSQREHRLPGARGGFFQAKLEVNAPGDNHEQEADAVAQNVVNAPEKEKKVQRREITGIQRLATPEEDEKLGTNDARMRRDRDIQKKSESTGTSASPAVSSKIEGSSGKGKPLPAKTLREMNSSFGVDFSTVHIHDNNESADLNKELHAQAFTHGEDIYFNEGKFDPENREGKLLLAHELTHVIQQQEDIQPKLIQRQLDPSCDSLLQMEDTMSSLSGQMVHALILADFLEKVAGGLPYFRIPGAYANPLRTAGLCGEDTSEIIPLISGGMGGYGVPDLVVNTGGFLQVAEIKPASISCAVDGEAQLLRYVEQGNAPDDQQQAWRNTNGIAQVIPMFPSTYNPYSIISENFTILVAWCSPGLLVYKVILNKKKKQEQEQNEKVKPPVVDEEGSWERVKKFLEEMITNGGQSVEEAIRKFLQDNPDLVNFIIWAGIGGIVATILEDIATAGAGIADDPLIIAICTQMIRIARAIQLATAAP